MRLPYTVQTHSVADTERVGAELASAMLADVTLPRFIALYGDLGVGKTAFTRGFTSVIAPNARVKSPTFALVNQYKGDSVSIFHFDMYRIDDEDELYSIGFYDYIEQGICLCEWSENIESSLPDTYVKAEIIKSSPDDTDARRITLCTVTR